MGIRLGAMGIALVLALTMPALGLGLPGTPQTATTTSAVPLPSFGPFTMELPPFFSDPGAAPVSVMPVPLPSGTEAASVGPFNLVPRPPIVIRSDADLAPPYGAANGVVGGSGTASDPYVISGWDIDGRHYTDVVYMNQLFYGLGYGIAISGTTKHVLITGNYLHNHTLGAIVLSRTLNVRVVSNDILIDNGVQPHNPSRPSEFLSVGGILTALIEDGRIENNRITVTAHNIPTAAVGIYLNQARPSTADLFIRGNTIVNTGNFPGTFVGFYDQFGQTRHSFGKELRWLDNRVTNYGAVAAFLGMAFLSTLDPQLEGNRVVNANPSVLSQALFIRGAEAPIVTANHFEAGRAGGTAAWVLQCKTSTLFGNTFANSTYGLVVQQSAATFMRSSRIDGNTYGFGLYGVVDADFVMDANHTSNLINGKPLVYLREGPGNLFVTNRTVNAAAFDPGWFGIYRGMNTTVVNLSVTGSIQGGLFVGLRSSRILDANGAGNLRGVELALTNNTTVKGYRGPYLAMNGAFRNRIENSTFENGQYGVRLFLASNGNRIEHNRFQGLPYGLVVNGSLTTNATLNVFDGNEEAVLIEGIGAGGTSLWQNNLVNRVRYHAHVEGATLIAHENYWGHPGVPTRGAPGDNVDIVTAAGGQALADRPAAAPYPGAGP